MEINKGITYIHEHITIDLSGVKRDEDCRLDTMEDTIEEMKALRYRGVANIVDVTNRGMGRNIKYVKKVQESVGINIICATGYYKEPFLPEEVYNLSEKELAKIMIDEIERGIDGTDIKASIIGEIGTSKNVMTPIERKVFTAGAIAHLETGKPITTHTTLGTHGLKQIEFFKSQGVNLEKVIIGHVDLSGDIQYILRMIDNGVYVAFDTIGKKEYMPEEKRLSMLQEICRRGLSERVVMSMDLTRKSHLRCRGGLGYSYLVDSFIPYIRENGVSQKDIDNMLINNAVKFFE